jgi:hypothetical protein
VNPIHSEDAGGTGRATADPAHSTHSSAREKVLEHAFISELLRALWREGIRNLEVLRSEVDGHGYDLMVGYGSILRPIQLKASYDGAKTRSANVHTGIAGKPGDIVGTLILPAPRTMDAGLCDANLTSGWVRVSLKSDLISEDRRISDVSLLVPQRVEDDASESSFRLSRKQ